MKILRRGIPPQQRIHTVECKRCDSRLEFTEDEAKFHEDQREGSYLSIECPVCHVTINHYPERRYPPRPVR